MPTPPPGPPPSSSSGPVHDALSDFYVGNIPFSLDEGDLCEVFSKLGAIARVHLLRDPETGQKRGCGWVSFTHPVPGLMDMMIRMGGRRLVIRPAARGHRAGAPGGMNAVRSEEGLHGRESAEEFAYHPRRRVEGSYDNGFGSPAQHSDASFDALRDVRPKQQSEPALYPENEEQSAYADESGLYVCVPAELCSSEWWRDAGSILAELHEGSDTLVVSSKKSEN